MGPRLYIAHVCMWPYRSRVITVERAVYVCSRWYCRGHAWPMTLMTPSRLVFHVRARC